MNIKLRIAKVDGIVSGKCAVCGYPGGHRHWDADMQAPVGRCCVEHVKSAERVLIHARMEQPEI